MALLRADSHSTGDVTLRALAMESSGVEWSSFNDMDLVMFSFFGGYSSGQSKGNVAATRSWIGQEARIVTPRQFRVLPSVATGLVENAGLAETVDRLPLPVQQGSSPVGSCRARRASLMLLVAVKW